MWNNKNFPTKDILNNISPNNPIYLTRIDGHSAWVNNQAIKKLDMDYKSLKNISGGKIINDCILIDNTMNPFKSILPEDSEDDSADEKLSEYTARSKVFKSFWINFITSFKLWLSENTGFGKFITTITNVNRQK